MQGKQSRKPAKDPVPRGAELAWRPPDHHHPWSTGQILVADSWPTRRDQPVSIALSPTADRLALSVGQRLAVSLVSGRSLGGPLVQLSCALAPALAWSPRGDKLAFRDDDGKGKVLDLSSLPGGQAAGAGAAVKMEALGVVSAMAFDPEGHQLAMLAPSLPGRMTLTHAQC